MFSPYGEPSHSLSDSPFGTAPATVAMLDNTTFLPRLHSQHIRHVNCTKSVCISQRTGARPPHAACGQACWKAITCDMKATNCAAFLSGVQLQRELYKEGWRAVAKGRQTSPVAHKHHTRGHCKEAKRVTIRKMYSAFAGFGFCTNPAHLLTDQAFRPASRSVRPSLHFRLERHD